MAGEGFLLAPDQIPDLPEVVDHGLGLLEQDRARLGHLDPMWSPHQQK
jgi:hypothetical protein